MSPRRALACCFAFAALAPVAGAAPVAPRGARGPSADEVDRLIAAAVSAGDAASARALLARLGFSIADLAKVREDARVTAAVRNEENLDDDDDLEGLVHVALRLDRREGRGAEWLHAIAWIDAKDDLLRVAARDLITFDDDAGDAHFKVELQQVHSGDVEDGIVRWRATGGGAACGHQAAGTKIVTFARKRFDRLLDFTATVKTGGTECDPEAAAPATAEVIGDVPSTVEVRTLAGVLTRTLKFDKATFKYR